MKGGRLLSQLASQSCGNRFAPGNLALSGQLGKQRLCLFQIERVEAFSEPAVDRSEKLAGLFPLALVAPEPRMLIAARSSQDLACC